MPRQPWYKEGRRPAKWLTCTECGRKFRDDRSAEEALLNAIFGETLCYACRAKREELGIATCTKCNEPVTVAEGVYHFENQPYHSRCLPYSG